MSSAARSLSKARSPLPLRVVGAAAAAVLGVAAPGYSQSMLIRTLEAETGRVIAGAIVVLIDSTNQRVAQGLTNEFGRLHLRAPSRGLFRLRADRIGHPGVLSDPVVVRDTTSVTLTMPLERVTLPELAVTGVTQCDRRAEGVETARLWEEARKGLLASQITSEDSSLTVVVRQFRRYRALNGRLKRDTTLETFVTTASPFVSLEPEEISAGGFIQLSDGQYRFLGPDARVLLSDAFLEDHCFEVARPDRKEPSLVGLGFRPVPGRRLPDIRGVLWVDRLSAELRRLEFQYVSVPRPVRADGLGGRIEFERLASGAWIVRDWYIRMPERVRLERRAGTRRLQRDTVVGYVDEGGMARPRGDATVALEGAAPAMKQVTTTMIELHGRVVSAEGEPLVSALVAVAELDSVLATDADGRFRLSDLPPGPLRLRLWSIGYAPLGIELRLSAERRLVDTSFVLTRVAQPLDSIVVTGQRREFRPGKLEEFERRRQMGFGKFFTREELHDPLRGGLDMQLRRVARVRLIPISALGGLAAAGTSDGFSGSAPCWMSVYIDGALSYSRDMPSYMLPDLTKINPLDLEAMEVYRSPAEIPPEYNATGSACGVILLWTRVR
jgi:hypothetical protein